MTIKSIKPDTSRDEKIIACLRKSMSGWLEAASIAYSLKTNTAIIDAALRRLEGSRVQRRTLTGSRAATEWAVKL